MPCALCPVPCALCPGVLCLVASGHTDLSTQDVSIAAPKSRPTKPEAATQLTW